MGEKFNADQLSELVVSVGKGLRKSLRIYIIGGFAMMAQGMKGATKDIDMVFSSQADADEFIDAAIDHGFRVDSANEPEGHPMDQMLVLKDDEGRRFDICVNRVLRGLVLTEAMKKRGKKTRIGNVEVTLASMDDIFLFKAITTRDTDLDDMVLMARTGNLDWDTIIGEARAQPDGWMWIPRLYGRLLELEKRGEMRIPVVKKLEKEATECQAMGLLLERMQTKKTTIDDAMEILQENDRAFVEAVLKKMVRMKLAKVRKGFYFNKGK